MTSKRGNLSNAGGTVDYVNDILNTPASMPFYSQVVWAGDTAYLAGQIALDTSGNLVPGGITSETEKIFDNLEITLSAIGLTLNDVPKASVYLTNMEDFAAMNAVYSKRMGKARPARETVIVKGLAKNATVEITLTAYKGNSNN